MAKTAMDLLANSDLMSTVDKATQAKIEETQTKLTHQLQDLLKEDVRVGSKSKDDVLTYGHAVLAAVVYERYESALAELDSILGLRKEYPMFGLRASPFVQHAKSLVKAIRTKRDVVKLPHLSRSKQNELLQALSAHFADLRNCVLNIEKIERHARKEDISSTRWFVLSSYFAVLGIFAWTFVQANVPDILYALFEVFEAGVDWVFQLISRWLWPVS